MDRSCSFKLVHLALVLYIYEYIYIYIYIAARMNECRLKTYHWSREVGSVASREMPWL